MTLANTITVKHIFTNLILHVESTHLVFQVVNCWEISGIIMLASQNNHTHTKKNLHFNLKKKRDKRDYPTPPLSPSKRDSCIMNPCNNNSTSESLLSSHPQQNVKSLLWDDHWTVYTHNPVTQFNTQSTKTWDWGGRGRGKGGKAGAGRGKGRREGRGRVEEGRGEGREGECGPRTYCWLLAVFQQRFASNASFTGKVGLVHSAVFGFLPV